MNLENILKKEIVFDRKSAAVVGVIFFFFATAFGAQVYVRLPFTPVPLTLQTFFVILSGAFLGRRLGALSQGIYVLLGGLGLPFFCGASCGILYMAGPTGGYLVGFIAAAYLVGKMMDLHSGWFWRLAVMSSGSAVILFFGAVFLVLVYQFSITRAILLGVLPFLPGDAIKSILAAGICGKRISSLK